MIKSQKNANSLFLIYSDDGINYLYFIHSKISKLVYYIVFLKMHILFVNFIHLQFVVDTYSIVFKILICSVIVI